MRPPDLPLTRRSRGLASPATASSNYQSTDRRFDGTAALQLARQATPTTGWHVFGRVTITTAGSGNSRGVAPYRCPFRCVGSWHLALVALPVPDVVQRRTPCGAGRITLHLSVAAQ